MTSLTEGTVIDVGEADFEERVLDASRNLPVVVDFWADWCQPCRILSPMLERLAQEHAGRFVLAKVDVDANPGLASVFGVQGIPTVKAFRDGRVVSEFVGVQPEDVLRAFLREVVPSEADGLVVPAEAARAAGDLVRAEQLYREGLALDPEHEGARTGLAAVLLAGGREDEARQLLAGLPPTERVRQLQAELELRRAGTEGELAALRARVESDGDDHQAALALAAAEAAAGEHRSALERCLRLVSAGADVREAARDLMVRIFEALGNDHPLTREFRPRLASALF